MTIPPPPAQAVADAKVVTVPTPVIPPEWVLTLRCGHWTLVRGNTGRPLVTCETCQRPEVVEHQFQVDGGCCEDRPW